MRTTVGLWPKPVGERQLGPAPIARSAQALARNAAYCAWQETGPPLAYAIEVFPTPHVLTGRYVHFPLGKKPACLATSCARLPAAGVCRGFGRPRRPSARRYGQSNRRPWPGLRLLRRLRRPDRCAKAELRGDLGRHRHYLCSASRRSSCFLPPHRHRATARTASITRSP